MIRRTRSPHPSASHTGGFARHWAAIGTPRSARPDPCAWALHGVSGSWASLCPPPSPLVPEDRHPACRTGFQPCPGDRTGRHLCVMKRTDNPCGTAASSDAAACATRSRQKGNTMDRRRFLQWEASSQSPSPPPALPAAVAMTRQPRRAARPRPMPRRTAPPLSPSRRAWHPAIRSRTASCCGPASAAPTASRPCP